MTGPRKINKPLVLYGKGKLGMLAAEIFKKMGIPFDHIDSNDNLDEWWMKNISLVAICIASEPYKPIEEYLRKAGYEDVVSIYDIFEAYPGCGITSGWFTGEISENDQVQINFVEYGFADYISSWQYREFRKWHENREELLIYQNSEYRTNRWYIPEVQSILKLGHEITYPELRGNTLRDIERRRTTFPQFQNQPMGGSFSYIQLHLEGRELENVEANMGYFQRNRPILAVTVYHSRDGLWQIEKTLVDNLQDYRFLFRLHAYQGQGAIFYCVPKERG